jgi:pyruvate, water dikinase
LNAMIKYLVEIAKEQLATWKLVRGEHFLSYVGVHPKALEAFDYYTGAQSGRAVAMPDWRKTDIIQLRHKPLLIKHIKKLIAGYTSAREYFISQLATKLTTSVHQGAFSKVIFRTTDFKTHDLALLRGSELFEVEERNPQRGNRGLGRYLNDYYHDLFGWELEASRRAAANQQVELGILFPCVRWRRELNQALARVTDLQLKPKAIGMMVEVEANLEEIRQLAGDLTEYSSQSRTTPMFLFGLEDLTQSMEAASREDPKMISFYEKISPALMRGVTHALNNSQGVDFGIHTSTLESIAGRNPEFAALLATSISFLVEDHLIDS